MDSQTDEQRLPYTEPLLREHGSLRDLTGKTGEVGKVTDKGKEKEKEKEKEGDKNQAKDIIDKLNDTKEILDKGVF
jgi:hypothetical protein